MIDQIKKLTKILDSREEEFFTVHSILKSVGELTDGYFDWQVGSEDEYLSDNFKRQLGYEPEEMPNKVKSWMDIIYKEDLELLQSELNKHFETLGEYPFQVVCRYTHKNGSKIRILCRGKVIKWDNNNPVRFVGVHIKL
jgi:PAS domain S-box-containing protein